MRKRHPILGGERRGGEGGKSCVQMDVVELVKELNQWLHVC
jgi:hypothetical protein